MATNSSQETIYGAGFSPLMGQPRVGELPIPQITPLEVTLTTAGGVRTLTAAEILGGLLVINCDDAQTATLPTATLLNKAVPAAAVGATVYFDLINTGDTTVTIAVGTGGTLLTNSNSTSTVATVVAKASKRFAIRITGVTQNGDASDSYRVYGFGSIAAACA